MSCVRCVMHIVLKTPDHRGYQRRLREMRRSFANAGVVQFQQFSIGRRLVASVAFLFAPTPMGGAETKEAES